MQQDTYFIIDFDSTFSKVEGLDILAEVSIQDQSERNSALEEIRKITDLGMEGKISFRESLEKRLRLLKANRSHLPELIEQLKTKVSKSFIRNKEFLESNKERVYIISNGFQEFITPIVIEYGVKKENVYANNLNLMNRVKSLDLKVIIYFLKIMAKSSYFKI